MRLQSSIGTALVVMTLAVYWQVRHHEFVDFDDPDYVTQNREVQTGLTRDNLRWAFSSDAAARTSNWHPLTWLSLMADADIHGDDAGGFLLTNLLLHLASVLILFAALRQLTDDVWKSAFVAALFALHPLQVESVAWVSERKGVLSTFFGLIAIYGYARFVRQDVARKSRLVWYLVVCAALACSLLSKQMLITLPFVLLLLDVWPLRRRPCAKLVWEKLPLFALSILFAVVAFVAQQHGGSVKSIDQFSFATRCSNAVVVYGLFVYRTVWPAGLAAYYPHPGNSIPASEVVTAALLLLCLTVAAITQFQRRPYVLIGWLWYLGTFFPVCGLVQLADKQTADRYAYIPGIGLFIAVTWLVPSLVPDGHWRRRVLPSVAALVLMALGLVAWNQTHYWRDSIALFERATSVTHRNRLAHENLGVALLRVGRVDDAIREFRTAIQIEPDKAQTYNNLGNAYRRQRRFEDAVRELRHAIEIDDSFYEAYNNLGNVYGDQGHADRAVKQYRRAIEVSPNYVTAHFNLGVALQKQGLAQQAMQSYETAIRIDPFQAAAHNNLGSILREQGKLKPAIERFRAAAKVAVYNPSFYFNLGLALDQDGQQAAAVEAFRQALRFNPNFAPARRKLEELRIQ